MNDKLAKPEPEECVAVVISTEHGIVEPTDRLAFSLGQPATVERVRELVPYDYIWNESTKNFEPVFVPGTEQDIHARENEAAQAKLLEMRNARLAERNARREPEQLPSKTQTWLDRMAKRLMG